MQKNNWTAENIPDQSGKIVVVTGSSSGIGYEATRVLANKNAKIIIAVRNLNKGENAKAKILAQNKNAKVEVMKIDLSDLSSVKLFADEFKNKFDKLDLLINNAGVMIPPYSKTKDGFELQFGTNHLGHFALTLQLLDLIIKTPKSRIVNVASSAHKYGNIDFSDLNWDKRKYKAWRAYGDSKIANLYFTKELAKKLEDKNILVTAAHPGWTATELQRHSGVFEFANKFFAMPIEQGTLPTLRAATDLNAKSGDYYGPDGWQEWRGYPVKVQPNNLAKDETIAKKLWKVSEELTKVKFNL
ncbi:MAG: SDR family NAD(P)-dependent oxidoreductase [Bacteroidetes bacterium]|nr:SDR family NAD(P)-dependent oxidoreductase [Bacteroidota bacterium]MBU1116640.1 SDR family NAD(P)-dependent oxidoreductase [Bacteroidota bacterium]MBU1797509.1 SDR family NAD(P)-dependent oxidoreductase [Bacteroidota bacterium]